MYVKFSICIDINGWQGGLTLTIALITVPRWKFMGP